jgi:hypothetical protein
LPAAVTRRQTFHPSIRSDLKVAEGEREEKSDGIGFFFDKATEQCGISVFISISLYDICRVCQCSISVAVAALTVPLCVAYKTWSRRSL